MRLTAITRSGAIALAATLLVAACGSSATPAPTAAPTDTAAPATTAPSTGATSAPSGASSAAPVSYRCTKGSGTLNGAGSTFINPLLTKMAGDYNTKCGVQINYQSIGSGGGVKAWQTNTVDFGASDAYLSDA